MPQFTTSFTPSLMASGEMTCFSTHSRTSVGHLRPVGYGSQAFHGNYGMVSLQGLRKPVYHAFQLLSRLGTKRAPVTGTGLSLNHGAIATTHGAARRVLVYTYSEDEERGSVEVRNPSVPAGARLTRVSDVENNILADWRALMLRRISSVINSATCMRATCCPQRRWRWSMAWPPSAWKRSESPWLNGDSFAAGLRLRSSLIIECPVREIRSISRRPRLADARSGMRRASRASSSFPQRRRCRARTRMMLRISRTGH